VGFSANSEEVSLRSLFFAVKVFRPFSMLKRKILTAKVAKKGREGRKGLESIKLGRL
jgi:hypothetical protein